MSHLVLGGDAQKYHHYIINLLYLFGILEHLARSMYWIRINDCIFNSYIVNRSTAELATPICPFFLPCHAYLPCLNKSGMEHDLIP